MGKSSDRTYTGEHTILIHSHQNESQHVLCGAFDAQKQKWETITSSFRRIRTIAWFQFLIGVLSSWNYLWSTNLFACFVGIIGVCAATKQRRSWFIVYLALCVIELMRNFAIGQHLFIRYSVRDYHFTWYEYCQVTLLVVQEVLLIPTALIVLLVIAVLSRP